MPSNTLSVLVVDVHSDTREMIATYFRLRGFYVVMADSGEEAIEVAHAVRPHFVLMDLSLPLMGWWEATWRLKAHPLTQHAIVVAVTCYAFGHERERAAAVGCDAYLQKPCDITALADAFERVAAEGVAALARHHPMNGV